MCFQENKKKVISSSDRIVVDADAGTITFNPVHKDDEGQYTCKALNDVGEASEVGHLTVWGTFKTHYSIFIVIIINCIY